MKNNRSIKLDKKTVKKHQLSTDPPPKNALFWKLWKACLPIAKKTLKTDFIKGIKNGTLDPVVYGGFNVSDIYYCYNGAGDYGKAVKRTKNKTLKAFLTKKYESYNKYNATFPGTWHIKNGKSIVPTKVCKAYSDFETSVAVEEDPIYCLIVMLPCEYLWAWLGAQLNPPKKGNLYADWITGNNYPEGAYAMGNFIEEYRKKNPINEKKALKIYKQAMTFEYQNFLTATPPKKKK